MQTLLTCGQGASQDDITRAEYIQHWMSTLLLGAPRLTSLTVLTDGVSWPPVLGQLALRHLELQMRYVSPWLDAILADLSLCSCLETLAIVGDHVDQGYPSLELPELPLHDMTTLKRLDLVGWAPWDNFSLPPGCMLRFLAVWKTEDQWQRWQNMGHPTAMLYLVCRELQAWPTGIQDMSGLQFLKLHCRGLQNQDLAALQHIPIVSLRFSELTPLLLTSGSWQSLQIWGSAGFSVSFSDVDKFVRDTARFLFCCRSQAVGGMFGVLSAACARQGVACHECRHTKRVARPSRYISVTCLNNVKLCTVGGAFRNHERFIKTDEDSDDNYWPSRAAYPELYG